jgi:8-oxo-dGTP pyrophosphatase MutT (NUDIX family)
LSVAAGATIALPGPLPARAVSVLAGQAVPVQPRDAATVILLRPGPGHQAGLQVFLLRRAVTMEFAPGACVFPGGSVRPGDCEQDIPWAGPGPARWGRRLDAPPGLARALVCAAVRETFEECGVLLAGPDPAMVATGTAGTGWEADRQAVAAGELSLAGLLRRRRLVLRSDLLRPWSRWVTPAVAERRYDTRFFAAALPVGQRARDVGGESERAGWVDPAGALAAARRGEITLLPPTAVTLAELAACGGLAAALTARRPLAPRLPEVVLDGAAARLVLPPGLEYPL